MGVAECKVISFERTTSIVSQSCGQCKPYLCHSKCVSIVSENCLQRVKVVLWSPIMRVSEDGLF